jgi:hypothetical protein
MFLWTLHRRIVQDLYVWTMCSRVPDIRDTYFQVRHFDDCIPQAELWDIYAKLYTHFQALSVSGKIFHLNTNPSSDSDTERVDTESREGQVEKRKENEREKVRKELIDEEYTCRSLLAGLALSRPPVGFPMADSVPPSGGTRKRRRESTLSHEEVAGISGPPSSTAGLRLTSPAAPIKRKMVSRGNLPCSDLAV